MTNTANELLYTTNTASKSLYKSLYKSLVIYLPRQKKKVESEDMFFLFFYFAPTFERCFGTCFKPCFGTRFKRCFRAMFVFVFSTSTKIYRNILQRPQQTKCEANKVRSIERNIDRGIEISRAV